MDARLYILAATFALMVVSLITVVVIAVRVRHRDPNVSVEDHPAMPSLPMDVPVDADLRGLQVPVPEHSPHAALLKPLAEKPVWEEDSRRRGVGAVRPAASSPEPVLASSALAEPALSTLEAEQPVVLMAPAPGAQATMAAPVSGPLGDPVPAPAKPAAAASTIPEGPGRIPQIGAPSPHKLPSAEEILASLEAEMAKQQTEDEPAAAVASEPASAAPAPIPDDAKPPTVVIPAAIPATEATVPRTASAAGLPAEQVQWRPEPVATTPALAPEPAPAPDLAAPPSRRCRSAGARACRAASRCGGPVRRTAGSPAVTRTRAEASR